MVRMLTSVTALAVLATGCADGGAAGADETPRALGEACERSDECLVGVCLRSEYGTPFCTRACEAAWEPCPGDVDADEGDTLCVSFEDLPNPAVGPFSGDLDRFCVPRCSQRRDCEAVAPAWEACDVPKYFGDPLFPALGHVRVCQSPSFQGKTPVDPQTCDWEHTVGADETNEANRCRAYCAYLDRCKERASDSPIACCEWGCFNRMITQGRVDTAWRDEARCYVDAHLAFPDTGPNNACTEPRRMCGGDPSDPTPPAAQ